GTTYKNIEITAVEWDGIRIIHSSGAARIPSEQLPEALQKKYHYDPGRVAAQRKQLEEKARAEEAKAAELAAAKQREWEQAAARAQKEQLAKADAERIAEAKRLRDQQLK